MLITKAHTNIIISKHNCSVSEQLWRIIHIHPETLLSGWWLCFMRTEEPAVTSKQTTTERSTDGRSREAETRLSADEKEVWGWDTEGRTRGGPPLSQLTQMLTSPTAEDNIWASCTAANVHTHTHTHSHTLTCFYTWARIRTSSPASVHMQKMYSLPTVSVWRVEHYVLNAITHRDQTAERRKQRRL